MTLEYTEKIINSMRLRFHQGIHPCMLQFLLAFYYDNEVRAWYDGNHIITDLDIIDKSKYLPLKEYGLEYFNGFIDLNEFEINLLKFYFKQ